MKVHKYKDFGEDAKQTYSRINKTKVSWYCDSVGFFE